MALRNVLILSYHFPPSSASGSFRMLGFTRHLPGHGWRATVVAPPGLPWEPQDLELLKRVPSEASVYHVPYTRNRVVRKLAMYAGWLPSAARACRRAIREQRPEAVLTSGPPHLIHALGLWVKHRYGLPWLADFRDPWYAEGRMERGQGVTAWTIGVREALVMRSADVVIANAPNACKILRNAYPQHRGKFVTLTNGYDRETFEDLVNAESQTPRPPDAPLRIVHAGAIYVGRDPRPFLDAVRSLTQTLTLDTRLSLSVNFFGPPPESGLDLASETLKRDLAREVFIHGQVPYSRSLREMVGADILLLMDTPGRTVGVPAKLYEYIGAGRPVLALGERQGDLAMVLEQSGIPYRIAPPDDRQAIFKALVDLVHEVRVRTPVRNEPHRFSREAIAGRLASLLDRCTTGKAVGAEPVTDLEPATALVELRG